MSDQRSSSDISSISKRRRRVRHTQRSTQSTQRTESTSKLPFRLSYFFPTFATSTSTNSNPESLMLVETELKQSKKAFIMGTNYKGTENSLKACINDCKRVSSTFESMGYQIYPFYSEKTPDCSKVMSELNAWFGSLKENDIALFYYSGHGSHVDNIPGTSNNSSSNGSEPDGQDEILFLGNNCFVLDDHLRKLIQKIPSTTKLLLIFDCCESGSMVDFPYRYNGLTKHVDSKHRFGASTIAISGCLDGKVSYEARGTGFLTDSIIKTVTSLKRRRTLRFNTGYIKTWFDFYLKVRRNMPRQDPEDDPQEIQLSYVKEADLDEFWL